MQNGTKPRSGQVLLVLHNEMNANRKRPSLQQQVLSTNTALKKIQLYDTATAAYAFAPLLKY